MEGVAKVDDKMTVENQQPKSNYHTVVSGDTLSKIFKEHYGDANKYPVIFEANKPVLKDPDKIYPGAGATYSGRVKSSLTTRPRQ